MRARTDGWEIRVSTWLAEGVAATELEREVEASLRARLRAEIVIQIRLYEPLEDLAGLLGDRLIRETVVSRVLAHQTLSDRYLMTETVNGLVTGEWEAADSRALLDAFFRVRELAVGRLPGSGRRPVVRARYHVSPVRFSHHLSLVALLAGRGPRSTAWTVAGGPGP